MRSFRVESLFYSERYETIILKLSTLCILAVNRFFLFQLHAHNMLNTYIYHQLPPTCFGVCYTIFRVNIALNDQKLQAFCNVGTKVVLYNVKYALFFLIYKSVITFKTKCVSPVCILTIL
jgi:hypothetical protein